MDTVSAIGGREVGRVYEGRARYPILVRFPKEWREDVEQLKQLPVQIQKGRIIPLQDVAGIISWRKAPPASNTKRSGGARLFNATSATGTWPVL